MTELALTYRCSTQRAACNALAVYLEREFDKLYDRSVPSQRVHVFEEWPEPGVTLPPRAVSVIEAGTRKETHLQPTIEKQTTLPDGSVEVTWAVSALTQPIQIDVWATHAAVRDLLCDDLDTILRRGPQYTLGLGREPVRDGGVLLQLDPVSGREGFVDFTLLDGPRVINDGNARQADEHRALISAELDVILTVKATSPQLARVIVKGLLDSDAYQLTLQKDGGSLVMQPPQI